MSWITNIASLFKKGNRVYNGGNSVIGFGAMSGHLFADTIFLNCVELLTDLAHDVTWRFDGSRIPLEVAFRSFFNTFGKLALNRIYTDGYVVIKHTQAGEGDLAAHHFSLARQQDYTKMVDGEWVTFESTSKDFEIYVMRSQTYQQCSKSDKQLCAPFLEYLDNTLNASNTISARMGAMVVCSPKNPTNAPMALTLGEEEKKSIEKQMREEYGALKQQSQVMVLGREMSWQVISLSSLDLKTADKVKMATTAIADRIKIPANQVSLIDANSSKSLANGTELREGDFNKYQSFERLLDYTFVQMARDCGLKAGASEVVQGEATASYYTIYNKPIQNNGQAAI